MGKKYMFWCAAQSQQLAYMCHEIEKVANHWFKPSSLVLHYVSPRKPIHVTRNARTSAPRGQECLSFLFTDVSQASRTMAGM